MEDSGKEARKPSSVSELVLIDEVMPFWGINWRDAQIVRQGCPRVAFRIHPCGGKERQGNLHDLAHGLHDHSLKPGFPLAVSRVRVVGQMDGVSHR